LTKLQNSILTIALLAAILLMASYPVFAVAKPADMQANPMYRIKDAGINPNALGPYNPYFTPTDIKTAYNLPKTGGSGVIAIVDAYSDPNVASNLATFDSQWSLPSASLVIHKMSSFVTSNSGWGMEQSLDVEWAHAIAPSATILLVEANSASTTDLLSAVNYAVTYPGVVAVSMSWGANEFSGEQQLDSNFVANGVVFFASAGDTGGVVEWPSASPNVVSVGGTTLTQTATGYTEAAWSGGGGGISAYESPSAAQSQALGNTMRETPDVAYNADPNTGFLVYDTYGYSGWYSVGGTSAGAPQWAAIQDLGNTVSTQNIYTDYKQPATYAKDFTDTTTGSNGNPAGIGYDLATGVGSPLTTNFAPATGPDFSLTTSPTTLTIQAGSSLTTTITATALNGYSGIINLVGTGANNWATMAISSIDLTSAKSGTSTATIIVPAGTQAGTYVVSISGSDSIGNGPNHITTVSVIVTTPDFSLTSSPGSLTIQSGNKATSTITATSLNGYSGILNLAPSGSAAAWSSINTPITVTPTTAGTSTLTITVPSGTASGTYSITVTATDSNNPLLTHLTTISITVTNPAFSLSASPASITIRSGSSGTSRITLSATGGFNSPVSLTASSSGGGLTTSFSPSSVTGSGTSTATITVPRTTTSGTYTVTITGTGGGLTHTTTVTVTVRRT
jgi:subtilase family serine protease